MINGTVSYKGGYPNAPYDYKSHQQLNYTVHVSTSPEEGGDIFVCVELYELKKKGDSFYGKWLESYEIYIGTSQTNCLVFKRFPEPVRELIKFGIEVCSLAPWTQDFAPYFEREVK
jgi:hypothetical protein